MLTHQSILVKSDKKLCQKNANFLAVIWHTAFSGVTLVSSLSGQIPSKASASLNALHSPCFSWVQPYTSRPGTHALPRVPSCTSPTGTSAHLQHKHPSSTESTLGVLRGFWIGLGCGKKNRKRLHFLGEFLFSVLCSVSLLLMRTFRLSPFFPVYWGTVDLQRSVFGVQQSDSVTHTHIHSLATTPQCL